MLFSIKSRRTGKVLYEAEGESLKVVLEAGVKAGVCFDGASLDGASLVGASLDGASLVGASLDGASLDGASFVGTSLVGASLVGASLVGASLVGADLTPIRDDLWAVLSSAPAEVPALRAAIADGRIDGSTYKGECACLVGTIANARHCKANQLGTLKPNANRPAERFFLSIEPGHTPDKSQFAALALQWVDEWLANMRAAFAQAPTADQPVMAQAAK